MKMAMVVSATALYAAIAAIILVVLSLAVIRLRVRSGISFGDGGDEKLRHAIRAQGNFIEYVPIALILMLLLELGGAAALLLHALGIALIGGRILHAISLYRGIGVIRVAGQAITLSMILVAALVLLYRLLA